MMKRDQVVTVDQWQDSSVGRAITTSGNAEHAFRLALERIAGHAVCPADQTCQALGVFAAKVLERYGGAAARIESEVILDDSSIDGIPRMVTVPREKRPITKSVGPTVNPLTNDV